MCESSRAEPVELLEDHADAGLDVPQLRFGQACDVPASSLNHEIVPSECL